MLMLGWDGGIRFERSENDVPAFLCFCETKMAGMEGFEPPNGGTRTHCLTTWRHPNAI